MVPEFFWKEEFVIGGALAIECKNVLESMFYSYNCTLEYKFIQQLKKDGFYEDPVFFTIDEQSYVDPCPEPVINKFINNFENLSKLFFTSFRT